MLRSVLYTWLLFTISIVPVLAQQAVIDSLSAELDRSTQIDSNRVVTLVGLAKAYSNVDPAETRRLANEILILSQSLKFPKGEGAGHQLLGISYAVQGNYAKALSAYIKAFEIREAAGDTSGMAQNYANIAGIYYSQGAYQTAVEYIENALDLMILIDDKLGLANTYHALGLTYLELNRLTDARKALQQSLTFHESLAKNSPYSGSILQAIGEIYLAQGNRTQAYTFFDEAIRKTQLIGDTRAYVNATLFKSNLLIKNGAYDEAEKSLTQIEADAEEAMLKKEQIAIYLQKSQIDSLQGDFQAALHNYHLYMEAKESMKGMNEDETITELRIKFETERRERENELLKRDQELKEAQLAAQKTTIRNQRYLALGAILGFLMLLSLAFALYRSNRNIKEANFALSASKEEIKQKKEELEGLNQTKDKWFAMICHDFKQPLAFMQGALSLLNTSELSVSERNMILHEMESRVRSASLLLDNLLLWAQDQLSGIIVRTEKIDMAQMIAESLILLDPIASKGQIEISKSFQQGQHVWADPTMIQLVLNNLLTSAIKLTHAGEEVRISTELKDGMLITHIADSGQAIPEEYLSKMFNFDHHRLIEGIAREQGMGISLLISKDFIEKNGGKIWVKTYQNRGNIFSFSLPSGDKPMPSSKQSNPMLPREPIQV